MKKSKDKIMEKVLKLTPDDLPEDLREGLQSFFEQVAGEEIKEEIKVPLLTISQKDLNKFIGLKAKCNTLISLFKAIGETLEEAEKEKENWWDYIEDKYELGHDKTLTVERDTGLISELVKKKDLEVVKGNRPLN